MSTIRVALVLACWLGWASAVPARAAQVETLADLTIHGNVLASDEEIRSIAAVEIGMPVGDSTAAEVAARLEASGRFERVEVRKRFASLDDPSRVLLVIVVDEGPVRIERLRGMVTGEGDAGERSRVTRSRGLRTMVLPILSSEDAYGFSYGVRLAWPDPLGARSRVSFPFTWGGERRAAVELEKRLFGSRFTRVTGGADLVRRTNPFYDEPDTRTRLWGRAEREVAQHVRVGAGAAWQRVEFDGDTDHVRSAGADLVLDTRLDPMLARNAVYGRVAWEHLAFDRGRRANRLELEGRAYLGLVGRTVLVSRVLRHDADAPLPDYAKSLFGGLGTVRGLQPGRAAGDTVVAGSAELLVPLTSPLKVALLGVSLFGDIGAVYDDGARLMRQHAEKSVGASVWVSATVLRVSVAVAHGLGASTRVLVGGGLAF